MPVIEGVWGDKEKTERKGGKEEKRGIMWREGGDFKRTASALDKGGEWWVGWC